MQVNKDQFSPLSTACKEGHDAIVERLLEAGEAAFGGKNTGGFRWFLTHVDKDEFSPLNTACKEGYDSIVERLLEAGEAAFGGKNTEGFRRFLTQTNKDQFSPLNSACTNGHDAIVEKLLAAGEAAFGGRNTEGFRRFLTQVNKDQFSPLNAACKAGHYAIAEKLIEAGKTAFGGRNTEKFNQFIEQKNVFGFTPLNAVCFQAKSTKKMDEKIKCEKIARLLISYGANPNVPNSRGFSARFNAPDNWTFVKTILKTTFQHKSKRSSDYQHDSSRKPKKTSFCHHEPHDLKKSSFHCCFWSKKRCLQHTYTTKQKHLKSFR